MGKLLTLSIFLKFAKFNLIYLVLTFLVSSAFATVIGSFIISTNFTTDKVIHDVEKSVGDFHLILGDVSDSTVDHLHQLSYIESASPYYVSSNNDYYYIYCQEEALPRLGLQILYGEFPTDTESIMVEKNYAVSTLVFDNFSDILGQSIDVGGHSYAIVGVFYDESMTMIDSFLLNDEFGHEGTRNVAIRFSGSANAEARLPTLLKDLSLPADDGKVLVNSSLMTAMGYGFEGAKQKVMDVSAIAVLLVLLVALSGVILINITNLMIDKNLKALGVFKVLQHSIGRLYSQLLTPVFIMVILGIIAGFFVSYVSVDALIQGWQREVLQIGFPFAQCLAICGVVFLLYAIVSLRKYLSIRQISPIAILKSAKLAHTQKPRLKNKPQFASSHEVMNTLRFFFSSCTRDVKKGIVIILGVSLCIIANVLMVSIWEEPQSDSLISYDYEIIITQDIYSDPSASAANQQSITMLKQQSDVVSVYENYQMQFTFSVPKASLSSQAFTALGRSAQWGNRVRDKFNDRINLPVLVLGYSDSELRMMGSTYQNLSDDECIIYDGSLAQYGVHEHFSNTDDPVIVAYSPLNEESIDLAAKSLFPHYSTDHLLFPVSTLDYTTVIIVNLTVFDLLFPHSDPSSYYLVAQNGANNHERIRGILTGSTTALVIDMIDVNAEHTHNVELTQFLFRFFLVITILFSIVNIYSLFALKLRNDSETYISYLLIGMKKTRIMAMFGVEALLYYIVSLGLALGGVCVTVSILSMVFTANEIDYTLSVPYRSWMIFEGCLLIVIICILVAIFTIINRLRPNPHSLSVE